MHLETLSSSMNIFPLDKSEAHKPRVSLPSRENVRNLFNSFIFSGHLLQKDWKHFSYIFMQHLVDNCWEVVAKGQINLQLHRYFFNQSPKEKRRSQSSVICLSSDLVTLMGKKVIFTQMYAFFSMKVIKTYSRHGQPELLHLI